MARGDDNGTKTTVAQKLTLLRNKYMRVYSRFAPGIMTGAKVLGVITFIASITCLTMLVVRVGFDHTAADLRGIGRILRSCHIVFLVNVIYNLIINARQYHRDSTPLRWGVDTAMLITLLPLCYPHPLKPWIPVLEQVLYSGWFNYSVLTAYAIFNLALGIISVAGKRTNPSLILSASFIFFILIGSLVLMMPKCTISGIEFTDALFVSTSAVCITGLTTVDVSNTFTPAGLLVVGILIQIGALGVMTFTSFFALFFSGRTSIYSQLMVKDMIYSKNINALIPTLLYILCATLVIEAAGGAAVFMCVHGTLHRSLEDELIFSAFHSLSAFCNAGFSNIEGGLSNPLLLRSNQCIYIVTSLLVLAGGIGFPILMNLRGVAASYARRAWRWIRRRRHLHEPTHLYDLNTKIVLFTTFWVTLVSAVLFFLFERGSSMAGMPLWHQIVQSVFNSFVPRSSGFSSMNPAGYLNVTLIMFVVLMWIGGASQSTGGGVKINTFATMLLNLKAVVLGRDRVTAYRRTISTSSIRRAHAVIGISIVAFIVISMLLVLLEPALPVRAVLYEAASALFTVGSSLGITEELSTASKYLLCGTMFLGRVGIISILVGIVGSHNDPPARFPSGDIIIN